MEREQFTFYRSFWEAMKALPKKDQFPFVMAVCSYALDGESKPLTGAPYASFLLVKPVLDKASKRASNGKQGGSKPKANRKQTESKTEANEKQTESQKEGEKEREKEKEKEVEVEVEGDTPHIPPPPPDCASVQNAYLDRINPCASQASLNALCEYARKMGPEVCLRAMDIALDEKKATWSYIRAILQDKYDRGVRCLEDWDALLEGRSSTRKGTRQSWSELAAELDREVGQ